MERKEKERTGEEKLWENEEGIKEFERRTGGKYGRKVASPVTLVTFPFVHTLLFLTGCIFIAVF